MASFRSLALALLLVIFCIGIFFFSLTKAIYTSFDVQGNFPSDCGLVFGAAVRRGERAGPAIIRRVNTAARLFGEGNIDRLILTGGKGSGQEVSEAEVMHATLRNLGVPEDAMTLETQASNTWENLLFSQELTKDCKTIVGISDRFHLFRIGMFARWQHYKNFSLYGADVRPTEESELRNVIREVLALTYYGLVRPTLIEDMYLMKEMKTP